MKAHMHNEIREGSNKISLCFFMVSSGSTNVFIQGFDLEPLLAYM